MLPNPPSALFASITVFLAASVWGLYWAPLRILETEGVGGAWPVFMINAPAALALAAVVALRWRDVAPSLGPAVAIGLLTGLGIALYACGLIYSSVVRATLLFYLTPVWATLIGMTWLGERAGPARWAAIVCGLVGMALLLSGGGATPLNVGDLFGLLSGIVWAFGAALIRRHDAVPLSSMTMFMFAFCALGALAFGAVAGDMTAPAADALVSVLPLSVLVSVAAILPAVWLIFWSQKFLFPGRVGLLMMSEVLVAVVSASLLLPEERMSVIEWCGAALVVGACLAEVVGGERTEAV